MSERKEEANADRTLTLLHELAGDVIDRRNMIGVHRVAQAERVGQQGRAKQNRPRVESDERPDPD